MTPEERVDDLAQRGYILWGSHRAVMRVVTDTIADERRRLIDLLDYRVKQLSLFDRTDTTGNWRSSDWVSGLEEAIDIIAALEETA